MADAEDSMEGGRQTNELVSQLLSNVLALTQAINNNGPTQARRTHENVEEEVSNVFRPRRPANAAGVQAPGPSSSSAQSQLYGIRSDREERPGNRPQFTFRNNFANKRKYFGHGFQSRKGNFKAAGRKPAGPFRRDIVLLAGPADDIVPRQGMKLYLIENQHVVKEVMLMKEWKAADVVAKIKDVFHEKLANCEISILESVHKKLMPPALERGSDLNGEKVSKIFKEKPPYIRPSIQILEPYDHDNGKNKKIKFSPENVVMDSDDSLDEYLQQNPFIDTIPKSHGDLESNVAEQCPDVNNPISTQQESAIQIMSTSGSLVEELSSNELVQQVSGQGHSPTNVHVINLVEEYGAFLESSDFEATDDVEDLMEENKTVGTEEASSSQVGDVKEILESLASVIDDSSISTFNISRNHLWESAKRGFNRKTFSPAKKMSVKFTDDLGASEWAVDLGGPRRELLTLLLQYLRNSSIFVGEEASKSLTSLAHHITGGPTYCNEGVLEYSNV